MQSAWSAADKFAAVLETAPLNEHDLGAYCRRKDILPEQIKRWRKACESADDWDRQVNTRLREERQGDRKRIRRLEAELSRKEKVLAEAAALLMLQKKFRRSRRKPRPNDQRPDSPQNRQTDH